MLTLHGALTAPLDADDMAALLRVRDVLSWVLLTPTISVGDTGIWASLLAPDHAVVNQAAGMDSESARARRRISSLKRPRTGSTVHIPPTPESRAQPGAGWPKRVSL